MKKFFLPDLGEGLPDAIIQQWYVKVGDEVKIDQPLAAMETAKAVVDVPSPIKGKIVKLHGKPGDTINTGEPLVEFEGEETKDAGTVVGAIESSDRVITEHATGINVSATQSNRIKASPAVRALAKELGIDLATITPSGPDGSISVADIKQGKPKGEKLSNVRRAMALTMSKAHQEVAACCIFDDADISNWSEKEDVTLRLIRAVQAACLAEPKLNAYFNGENNELQLCKEIHLGLAVDTKEGLYVPVLKNIEQNNDQALRQAINQFKELAKQNKFPADMLKGATITLSNFGVFAGRYATAMIVPPMVAIIAIGKSRNKVLPVSLTFDHRAVTGGEAARFLQAFLNTLSS